MAARFCTNGFAANLLDMGRKRSNYLVTPMSYPTSKLPCSLAEIEEFLSAPTSGVETFCRKADGDFLILGAGGKMGLHLSLMLKRGLDAIGKKSRVTAVSRFSSVNERDAFEERGINTIACDLADPCQLSLLQPCENVIFMAGAKFGTAGRPDLLRLMNVEMPWNVAQHFRESAITAFSTGCVYSYVPVDSGGSKEDGEVAPVGAYAQSCLGREDAFTRAAKDFGTRIALIRLNYSVEFRYGVLVDIASKVLCDEPVDVTMGHFNAIWQRDAVSYGIQAHALASKEPFIMNATGAGTYATRDVALRFGSYFGKLPIFTGSEEKTAWLNNASKAQNLFGLPETTMDEMIEWVATWLLAGHPTLGKPTGFEKRDGNF